jgi:hypothetical protein
LPFWIKEGKEIKSKKYFYAQKAEPITALPLFYPPLLRVYKEDEIRLRS